MPKRPGYWHWRTLHTIYLVATKWKRGSRGVKISNSGYHIVDVRQGIWWLLQSLQGNFARLCLSHAGLGCLSGGQRYPLDKSLSSGETQGDFTGLGYPIGRDLFRGHIALTTFSTSGQRSQVGIGDIQTSILLAEPRVGLWTGLCVQSGNAPAKCPSVPCHRNPPS